MYLLDTYPIANFPLPLLWAAMRDAEATTGTQIGAVKEEEIELSSRISGMSPYLEEVHINAGHA